MRGGGAGAHDRPVAQHVILDRRPDPPGGIGRETHLTFRLETRGRLHQAEIAFLDQVVPRPAVVAEATRGGAHQPHMRGEERKSVVYGKSVYACDAFGGGRIIKKK